VRTIRIYQPGNYEKGQTIALSKEASLHVGTVLRMQPKEHVTLFRGDNLEFKTTITEVNKKQITVTVIEVLHVSRESSRVIHLAQGISKGERMEFVIQKAVELGVTSITPLLTERCVVKLDSTRLLKKHQQWQAICIAACEQSGRNQLPTIHQACSFDDYLASSDDTIHFVLDPTTKASWRDYVPIEGGISLMIGPEGGLSSNEIAKARALNFHPLTLGPRILRTETATIAGITLFQALAGDF
jgi:16S rRNA (uracil1498-N3)-methyltransferase